MLLPADLRISPTAQRLRATSRLSAIVDISNLYAIFKAGLPECEGPDFILNRERTILPLASPRVNSFTCNAIVKGGNIT